MAIAQMIVVLLAAVCVQSGPPLQAQPPTAAQADRATRASDFVSLERIRRLMQQPGTSIPPASIRSAARSVPVFRVEVVEFNRFRLKTFEDDLKEVLARPAGSAAAGFFDLYSGPHRAGAGPEGGGGGVGVDPLFFIHMPQRWAHRRAHGKAKQEVEEELKAFLEAQKKLAEKRDK